MRQKQLYSELFQALDKNTTIITPNRRLSANLHKCYQQYQIQLLNKSWETPDILPLSSWIQRLWIELTNREFGNKRLLLNAAQEQFLWEMILTQAKDSTQLLQIAETADIAKSAWGLLKQWRVSIEHPLFKSADDYLALYEWSSAFQSLCAGNQWLDNASLMDAIIDEMKASKIHLPKQLVFIGFNEFSPQVEHLLATCEATGVMTTMFRSSENHDEVDVTRTKLLDQDQEIVTMARWAKSTLSNNKEASIACVIPTLDKNRDRVLQIFSEVFAEPHTYTNDPEQCQFNLSAGRNLTAYPIINTALKLLTFNKKRISAELFSYILASPFVGEAESERVRRASFDSLLRQANLTDIDLARIILKSDDNKQISLTKTCAALSKRISHFLDQLAGCANKQTYSQWAQTFNELLTTLGWPGERSLNSEEYQVVESWLSLLTEYMSLDQIASPVNFNQALQSLHKMASKTVFQAKSPEAPIQVLGVLEAAGMPFDYVWVSGLDDISWPPQPRPNPFIPKPLQRELKMPHATAERELIYCQQLTEQFKQCAQHLIFSYAEKLDDLELQPSPLIRDIPEVDQIKLDDYLTLSARIYDSKQLETIVDETAPAVGINEKVHGGVSIIKTQALCPFKAFAEWRLHAHELEKPLPGLRAKDRGSIIHKVLELLWNELQDHATLIALSKDELDQKIIKSIEVALAVTPNSRSDYTQYIALEKQRLLKLINDWLAIEKTRDAFKVSSNEKTAQITLNKLQITIKVDRIDELPDGKKLIIDYKTGKNNQINAWFSERPEEPQLPIYSLIDPIHTVGLTFAQVASGEHGFKGVSKYTLDTKGIKPVADIKQMNGISWDQQLIQWQSVLTKLSDNFYDGDAKVDPKDPPQTCEWCGLKPVCRINEDINLNKMASTA